MHFLPDVYVPCDICQGKRYNRETLEIQFKGKNIHEVLSMTVEQAHQFFNAIPAVEKKLRTLIEVGLGYITLGQNATTLSGGEAQRVKLALELSKRDTGTTLYILDEPTTGLDPRGRQDMWQVIQELVKGGVTLLLTTQYLEEADQLADEIAVIDRGTVIARGTSDSLKKQVGGERLEITVEPEDLATTNEIVAKISGHATHVDLRTVSAPVLHGSKDLMEALRAMDEAKIHPLDIGLKRPSLDDVFLSLTGHVAEETVVEPIAKKRRGGKK